MKTISQGSVQLADYDYDNHGRREKLTLGNGRVVEYDYESDGALDSITHVNLVDTDADGLGDADGTAVWSFDYNKANQVTSKTLPEMFRWQPAAPTRNDYTVNGLNQYTATTQGGPTLTYDDNGNLIQAGIWTYGYDDRNRLTSSEKVEGGVTTTVDYVYGVDDERIHKTVTIGGSSITYDGACPGLDPGCMT